MISQSELASFTTSPVIVGLAIIITAIILIWIIGYYVIDFFLELIKKKKK